MFSNVPAQFLKDILILIQLKKKKKLSTDFNFMTLIPWVYDSLVNILASHKGSYMTGLSQLSPCNMDEEIFSSKSYQGNGTCDCYFNTTSTAH